MTCTISDVQTVLLLFDFFIFHEDISSPLLYFRTGFLNGEAINYLYESYSFILLILVVDFYKYFYLRRCIILYLETTDTHTPTSKFE